MGLGLAGNAIGTALISVAGDRIGRAAGLAFLTVLGAGGLLGMALGNQPALLSAVALCGMVNGMGRDRGPAQTLEQSLLPTSRAARRALRRTRATRWPRTSPALSAASRQACPPS